MPLSMDIVSAVSQKLTLTGEEQTAIDNRSSINLK